MATTSKEPWSVRHNPCGTASIFDFTGRLVGVIADGQDAERIVKLANGRLQKLEERIEELEDKLRDKQDEIIKMQQEFNIR